jgi:lactate racemase
MSKSYYLNLDAGKRDNFSLPPQWTPVLLGNTEEAVLTKSASELAAEVLSQEVTATLLRSLAKKTTHVAVIVDDNTRPTPVRPILDMLLKALTELGLPSHKIVLVVACGTHVAMDNDTLVTRFGKEILAHYTLIQHNAYQTDLTPFKLSDGRVVGINPAVASADARIGISSILPHPMAGYGGGPKILMPGVCNLDFIMHHHMTHTIHPGAAVGETRGNPFHEDCMSIAQQIGLDLSINCVYDQDGHIANIVAGTLEGAFHEAVEECTNRLSMPFSEKVDITIASSYPHTHGIQLFKGLGAADAVTKPAGAILMAAPLVTPIPETFLDCFLRTKDASAGDAPAYVQGFMSQGKPFLPDMSAEYNMAMSSALRRPSIRTILVSSATSAHAASILGFEHVFSIDDGLALLEKAYPAAKVAIFPSGGLIIPFSG